MADVNNCIEQIRTAIYGKEIRSSIADSIELINKEEENTAYRQQCLETYFDSLVIDAGNSNAEVVVARGTFPQLKNRLDDVDTKMNLKASASDITTLKDDILYVRKYPIASFEIAEQVKDKSYPYGHVARYGAVADYIKDSLTSGTDNTLAIQNTIDSIVRAKGGKLEFGGGAYRVDGTLYLNAGQDVQITVKGLEGKYCSTNLNFVGGHSVLVKNTPGSIFHINLNADGSTFVPVVNASGGMYNLCIHDLGLCTQVDNIDVIGFNHFRSRIHMYNIWGNNLYKLMQQNTQDTTQKGNYSDFCYYHDIFMSKIKKIGLELVYPDGTTIERIYFSEYASTTEAGIKIAYGGGFAIKECVFTWQLNNYSTSVDGSSAYIKIENAQSFSVENIYCERVNLTNAIILNTCSVANIKNVHDKYETNSLIKMYNCNGINVNGMYRNVDIREGYYDVYFVGVNRNITIKNVVCKRKSVDTERTMIVGGTISKSELTGTTTRIFLNYNGSAWVITDEKGNIINSLLANGSWQDDSFAFLGSSKVGKGIIRALEPIYINDTSLSHLAVENTSNTYSTVMFFNRDTNTRVKAVDVKCKVMLTVDIF